MTQGVRADASLAGVRVLLVDDHAVVRGVILRLLEEFGARVTAVPGVPEALEAFERERPNVVLSDLEMPGEDGYALIRKVRALPRERGGLTPAAALTGFDTAADRARVLRAGFQAHMAKPVDARALVTLVAILAAHGWMAFSGRTNVEAPLPHAAAERAPAGTRQSVDRVDHSAKRRILTMRRVQGYGTRDRVRSAPEPSRVFGSPPQKPASSRRLGRG